MRLSIDTGGTFTDLVVENDSGGLSLYKAATTPDDPVLGVLNAIDLAADANGESTWDFLERAELLTHATTRATNAILTNSVAVTGFLTTLGHPDILLFREGGRKEPFNYGREYIDPYIPRSRTFEIPERITSDGTILEPLDETAVFGVIDQLARQEIEAVGVCLLWSVVNPVHEKRVGEMLDAHLPNVPVTLSHVVNPTIREYRRASATVIDASLKPVMTDYLTHFDERLRAAGFAGRILTVTATGGVLDAAMAAEAPIHTVGSGPAMAPVAGRHYARRVLDSENAVVADAGGTSYDVSLVRRGRIPLTRETWLGEQFSGHMTGFSSVDVKSIGAGGGSIAWVDEGGLLHVGPRSAGAVPGPACYGRGGQDPTLTDACLVLGYVNPDYFLGGAMSLDRGAAAEAIERKVARKLTLDLEAAAGAVYELATEHMVRAIEDITLNQGIDPADASLVAGGGAAGLNAVAIARRLGMPRIVIPQLAPGLSATGALMSDLIAVYAEVLFTTSDEFRFDAVNAVLEQLAACADAFTADAGTSRDDSSSEFFAEVRYPHQVWELQLPLRESRFAGSADVEQFRSDFHALHREIFAISDPESSIEVLSWGVRARTRLWRGGDSSRGLAGDGASSQRHVYFPHLGRVEAKVRRSEGLTAGEILSGPAIIESPATTVVVDEGAAAERAVDGSLIVTTDGAYLDSEARTRDQRV